MSNIRKINRSWENVIFYYRLDLKIEWNCYFVFIFEDNERNPETAIARLNLVVQEAYILTPSPTTASRHRVYCFHSNKIKYDFFLGALNPYCEITVSSLTLRTPFIKRTNNPKWNESMQFPLYNLAEDIIHINIFDHEYFSPNGLFKCYYFYKSKHN